MLSKCANPACSARFRYLHEGRIFNIEMTAPLEDRQFPPRIERFWLCDECAPRMTVVFLNGQAITVPLESIPINSRKTAVVRRAQAA